MRTSGELYLLATTRRWLISVAFESSGPAESQVELDCCPVSIYASGMRYKPYTAIASISPEFVQEIVDEVGIPDNIVESAEGTMVGLPDVEKDPEARALIEAWMHDLGRIAVDGSDGDQEKKPLSESDGSTDG